MKKLLVVSNGIAWTGIAVMLAVVALGVPQASASTSSFYLHGSGPNNNPPTLSLDQSAPLATAAKYKDSSSVNFGGGNPWQTVGGWDATPIATSGQLSSLGNADVWLGLKNSDDQGTQFDVRTELLKNGAVVATGQTRCMDGIVRNASSAKKVSVPFTSFLPVSYNGSTDVMSLRVLTRIGTNADDTKCAGHSNATGLRLYFDAASRPSSLQANFSVAFAGPRVYVTNTDPLANNVAVIDPSTGTVLYQIPVGNQPRGVAANGTTHRVYAVNTYGSQSVSVIDTTTDTVVDTIPLGATMAFNAALNNDGSRLYLSGYTPGDESLGANLTVIDTATHSVIQTVHGFRTGSAILVVSPDGSKVYYTDSNCCDLPHPNGFVRVIDTTTYAVTSIEVGPYPVGIAVSPDGSKLYVANGAGDSLSIVDTAAHSVIGTLTTPSVPNGVTANATGTRIYVTASSGFVMVVDTTSDTTIATVPVSGNLTYAAVSADGGKLFVAGNDAHLVTVMSTVTNTVIDTLTTGFAYPWAIAVTP